MLFTRGISLDFVWFRGTQVLHYDVCPIQFEMDMCVCVCVCVLYSFSLEILLLKQLSLETNRNRESKQTLIYTCKMLIDV